MKRSERSVPTRSSSHRALVSSRLQQQATGVDRNTHRLSKQAIRHSSAAGYTSRTQEWIETLTRYQSRPSGTRQQQVTAAGYSSRPRAGHRSGSKHSPAIKAGHRALVSSRLHQQATGVDRNTHTLSKQAIGHSSAAGYTSRPQEWIETLTSYQSRPSGTRQQVTAAGHMTGSKHSQAIKAAHRALVSSRLQQQATGVDRNTHSLSKQDIGHSSAAGYSSRPQEWIETLTSYQSRPSGTRQQQVTPAGHRQATGVDRNTHGLSKQAIGHSLHQQAT
jgi:SLT domain-containing protein